MHIFFPSSYFLVAYLKYNGHTVYYTQFDEFAHMDAMNHTTIKIMDTASSSQSVFRFLGDRSFLPSPIS